MADGPKTLIDAYLAQPILIRKKMFTAARRIVRHDERAEDVVARVLVDLSAGKSFGWSAHGDVVSFFCAVAVNYALNFRRLAVERREHADMEDGAPDSGVPGSSPTPLALLEMKFGHDVARVLLAEWRESVADNPIATALLADPSAPPEDANVVAERFDTTPDAVRKARRKIDYELARIIERYRRTQEERGIDSRRGGAVGAELTADEIDREHAEAEGVIDAISAMTDDEIDRELATGGVDVAKVEARAREDARRLRRSVPPRWRSSWALLLALPPALLLAVGLVQQGREADPGPPRAAPPDAANETDAGSRAHDLVVPSAAPEVPRVLPPGSSQSPPP